MPKYILTGKKTWVDFSHKRQESRGRGTMYNIPDFGVTGMQEIYERQVEIFGVQRKEAASTAKVNEGSTDT